METTLNYGLFKAILVSIAAEIAGFYSHLAPWLVLGLVLVLTDLRYGIFAARRRGEVIRFSRACRRTVNKTIDYLCWVTVAELLSRTLAPALGIPIVSLAVLLFIYGIEISSAINNYLQYKGIRKRIDFFAIMKRRDLKDCIEEYEQELKTKISEAETE